MFTTVARVSMIAALLWGAAPASADMLALPDNLAGFSTAAGEHYFDESHAKQAYFPLASHFLTQKTQSYCGVASIVMVLNAMKVEAPAVPEYEPYRTFTQDNVLDDKTDAVLPREVLARMGMTLDQIGGILASKSVPAIVTHAGDSSLDVFRKAASEAIGQDGHFVIVNYLRRALGQERGGHISPLAAYDATADRFLLLDVARYKYPPVWVTTADLFGAMSTVDGDNAGRTRGWVVVGPATP